MRRVEVRYRVDVRVDGAADFPGFVASTLADTRGWTRAGFDVRQDASAPFTVVLAPGADVRELCRPYDTYGLYSCQIGPVVAIASERWFTGASASPGPLDEYRRMLVNHEMGHLLGQHHRSCPGRGRVAPLMQPQSGGLHGCTPNAWPLASEIARAARHDLKLAPGYGE
jgi:hypothetical protein